MMKKLLLLLAIALMFSACMNYGPSNEDDFLVDSQPGVFITNDGNFMYGNASLSFYSKNEKTSEDEVFVRANGFNLGDVNQSMSIRNGLGYLVVNNSGVIFAIDVNTFKVTGSITGLVSPRYIHFISDTKAYVTDLYGAAISIINPQTYTVTGRISTGTHKSTEQMAAWGKYVFTNCWSYDNKILVIDTDADTIVDSITVSIQPQSLVADKNGKIWALTDGGYEGSPYGYEAPSLYCIDAATRTIERQFQFSLGDSPRRLCTNGTRDTLYFINKDIWKMPINASTLPASPIIPYSGTIYYGLGVDPQTSEIYVADAIDYVQRGKAYRYTPQAVCTDTISTGICPSGFYFTTP